MAVQQTSRRISSIKQLYAGLFSNRIVFHTPISQLPYGTGEHTVQGCYHPCGQCGTPRYSIFSHATMLYQDACPSCGLDSYGDVSYYSKSTSEVQTLLAEALPEYRALLNDERVKENRHAIQLALHRARRDYNKSGLSREWSEMSQERRIQIAIENYALPV